MLIKIIEYTINSMCDIFKELTVNLKVAGAIFVKVAPGAGKGTFGSW